MSSAGTGKEQKGIAGSKGYGGQDRLHAVQLLRSDCSHSEPFLFTFSLTEVSPVSGEIRPTLYLNLRHDPKQDQDVQITAPPNPTTAHAIITLTSLTATLSLSEC